MKKIYWNIIGKEVLFKINWFEFLILKNLFKKKKYEILKPKKLTGQKFDVVILDECENYQKSNKKQDLKI